jgi:hypothetical protein
MPMDKNSETKKGGVFHLAGLSCTFRLSCTFITDQNNIMNDFFIFQPTDQPKYFYGKIF